MALDGQELWEFDKFRREVAERVFHPQSDSVKRFNEWQERAQLLKIVEAIKESIGDEKLPETIAEDGSQPPGGQFWLDTVHWIKEVVNGNMEVL